MITPSEIPNTDAVTFQMPLPDRTSSGVRTWIFPCLQWIFGSGLKRWTEVSSWFTNLRWQFSGSAWKRIRSPGNVSFWSDVSFLGTHLAVSPSSPKYQLTQLHIVVSCAVRHLSFKNHTVNCIIFITSDCCFLTTWPGVISLLTLMRLKFSALLFTVT